MAALLYGFLQLADIASTPAVEVDRGLLISAVQTTTEQHNAEVNQLLNLFVEDTTEFKFKYRGQNPLRSQPLDQYGRSLPVKGEVTYDLALPIFASGNAWGINWITKQKITVQKLNDLTSDLLMGDFRRTRDDLLAAFFNSTNGGRTFTDEEHGDLSVQGLANGDGVVYVKKGVEAGATDTHYLGQADAIDDTHNPYSAIYTELTEHGENGGEVVTFIATDLVDTTQNLTDFVGIVDPAITQPQTAAALATTLGVQLPPSATLLGRVNMQWIVQWPSLPSGYILSIMTAGPRPLRRRLDPEAGLQGFRPVAERVDFPYFDEQWFRRQGFGGWNRVGAVVYRIGGAWAIPTGYDTFVP